MGHMVQIWRLPLEANVKLNLSNKGLGRDDKGRHFFFLGLTSFFIATWVLTLIVFACNNFA